MGAAEEPCAGWLERDVVFGESFCVLIGPKCHHEGVFAFYNKIKVFENDKSLPLCCVCPLKRSGRRGWNSTHIKSLCVFFLLLFGVGVERRSWRKTSMQIFVLSFQPTHTFPLQLYPFPKPNLVALTGCISHSVVSFYFIFLYFTSLPCSSLLFPFCFIAPWCCTFVLMWNEPV